MIARDVDNACSFARFAQNLLDDVVMLLRPVAAAAYLPDVNEIAHDIKHLEIVLAQEIEQSGSTARTRSQMDIRYPGRAHASRSRG